MSLRSVRRLFSVARNRLDSVDPIALAGHMQQDLVDQRRWVREEDYLEGLALAQLAPGPLAAQLAIYLGYIRAGVLGATAVRRGVRFAFVSDGPGPPLPLTFASVAYTWMQGMFYGIGAAIIEIIARSAFKLTKAHTRQRQVAVGDFRAGSSMLNCMDFAGDHLAIPARWNRELVGQGLAQPFAA